MAELLKNVTIADFSQMGQGGIATQKLGDMGADVIKIEPPRGDLLRSAPANGQLLDGESTHYLAVNRNKRSITLNLKTDRGQEIAREIIREADLLFENFRPGVMGKFDLGYEDVQEINPGIIYVSGSGFGDTGPYADRPGQDILIQAMSGLASSTGRKDDPPTPAGAFICDYYSAVMLALHAMVALHYQERTGEGQKVEGSLFSSGIDFQGIELTSALNLDIDFERSEAGIGHPLSDPPYGVFETSDGHIAISFGQLDALAEELGLEPVCDYADQRETFEHRDKIKRQIEAATRNEPTEPLLDRLADAGLWVSEVNDYEDLPDDPQVEHNDMIVEMDHPEVGSFETTGIPMEMSAADERYEDPPTLGQHTDEILREFGFSDDDIAAFRDDDVIGTGD